MMSLVEVWNKNEESPTKIPTEEQHHHHHRQHQEQQHQHQHYQTRRMQLDTMQDIICEEETVRYVHVKSEDGSGGNNNNNCISSNNNNNNGINSSSSNSSNNNLPGMDKDEKRMRREIANSNERRRMQSINAGFQSLRQMLPHHEGEKLSKAAILQQTAEYIYSLEQEKTRLLSQNCQLKRLLDQQDHNGDSASQVSSPTVTGSTIVATGNGGSVVSQQTGTTVVTTVAKKRKIDTIVTVQPVSDSSDEGLGSMSPEPVTLRGVSVTTGTSNGNNVSSATTGGVTTNSSSSNNGRQCTTVNFSVKDFLELKHQLDIERRQKSIVEDRLKALERQLYPTRVQYQDSPDLHVPSGDCSTGEQQQQQQQQQSAPEEVAVSIIHKPIVAGSVVGGKLSRGGQELVDGGMSVISLDSNSLGKGQQIVVCPSDLIEEALSMQTVSGAAPTKQLLIPLKDEKKMLIKRSRSRSPTVGNGGEPTVVTLPPKKKCYPSILEAAIKAEPKVEVERISSPSSIVVTDDQMVGTSAGSHVAQVQLQPINIYHRHNLETIVEAIRHLEGDAFDKVLPAQQQQQQQQQQQSSLHQSQPQPTQPTSQSTIQQRPMQDVPLALTTSKQQQQQQQQQQPKSDRDHRQSQLEPYLKFRTTPGSTTTGTATTVAIVASADPNNIVTVAAPPPASSIIAVSIASTGSSTHPSATSGVCHSPAASSTTASTIVANGTAAASSIPQHVQQTTAAQILQQQQCRPGVIVVKQHS